MSRPERPGLGRRLRTRVSGQLVAALLFTVALAGFERRHLRLGFGGFVLEHLRLDLGAVAMLALVVLGLAVTVACVWSSLLARPALRALGLMLFVVVLLLQYGYVAALGEFVGIDDLNLALWGSDFVLQHAMARTYVDWTAMVPATVYALLLVVAGAAPGPVPAAGRAVRLGVLGVFVATVASGPAPYPTVSPTAFLGTVAQAALDWPRTLQGSREAVTIVPAPTPGNNVVMVVDESVRGDHLGVNGYHRDTTPYLAGLARSGQLANWGVAVSGANCSVGSNALLWVGFPASALPARAGELRTWPTILQYARAAGYRTHVLDGNLLGGKWLGRRLDWQYVDHRLASDAFGWVEWSAIDFLVAREIRRIVDGSTGNFVWVTKRGLHTPYFAAFPPGEARWTPWLATYEPPDRVSREALVNAYDNALRYNVDGFLRALDVPGRRSGLVVLYTADHGQNLSERGEAFPHCRTRQDPGEPAPHVEAGVPLLMLANDRLLAVAGSHVGRASHANLFATLLDLMDVPRSARRHPYAPSLLDATAPTLGPRCYFTGDGLEGREPRGERICLPD